VNLDNESRRRSRRRDSHGGVTLLQSQVSAPARSAAPAPAPLAAARTILRWRVRVAFP